MRAVGRRLAPWVWSLLLAAALVVHGRRIVQRAQAGVILARAEEVGLAGAAQGPSWRRAQLPGHLRLLREARRWRPEDVRVLGAIGDFQLLLDRPRSAVRSYEAALELESRPAIYANLGQAHLALGDRDAATEAFRKARLLDPRLGRRLEPFLP